MEKTKKLGKVAKAQSYRIGPVRLYMISHYDPGSQEPGTSELIVSHVNVPTLPKFLEAPAVERTMIRVTSPQALRRLAEGDAVLAYYDQEHDFVGNWEKFVEQARNELQIYKSKSRTGAKSAGF